MTLTDAYSILQETSDLVIGQYPDQLSDWSYKLNPRLKTSMGRCVITKSKRETKKVVEFSSRIICLNLSTRDFETKLTRLALHEWAHALDWEFFRQASHGETWKRCCAALGIPDEEPCFDSFEYLCIPKGCNYAIKNKINGKVVSYHKTLDSTKIFKGMDIEKYMEIVKLN
jgi:hypothetical protein